MLTKSMNQWFLPGKKMLLAALLFFVSARAYSIIYWQAYPITAVIGTNGSQQRLECSVYDSLLGSWQYYNTPYFNSAIDKSGSSASIIVFHHPLVGGYYHEKDSMYGYVIYDQELHQFAPVIEHHSDPYPDYASADVYANEGIVTIYKYCCRYWDSSVSEWTKDEWLYIYTYNIKSHSWSGGNLAHIGGADNGGTGASVYTGGFILRSYNDIDWNPEKWGYYLTWFDGFPSVNYPRVDLAGGDQDLFWGYTDGLFYPVYGYFSAIDPLGGWATFVNTSYFSFLNGNGIFYAQDYNSGHNFFGIYDDSLHQWTIDSTNLVISNIKIKDRVVAYKSSNKVYYEVFSPTSRTWVKDSTVVTNGIDSIYIQEGTVKWVNNNGVTHKAGYNDATGWGNYNTPLLLNFHLTDFYSSSGEPMIFVRNYSIGTDSVMYDFGDGITTGYDQSSLYHLYKVNGHYKPGGVNYNICISTYNSTGLQSSCTAVTHPCSATFNNVTNSCPGACNGSIHAVPQTGQAPFTYHWSNGATTSTVNSLCTGYYAVTVTDNAGCSITQSLQINSMQLDSAVVNTCTSSCSGEASVFATNGTFPYTYLWSSAATTGTILNLCAGNYTVTVTDNNGCTKSTVVAVTNYPNSLTINNYVDPPCCSSCANGVLDYEMTGTRPSAWSLTPNIGVIDTGTYNGFFIIYIYNLPPGVYELTLTDGFGCPVVITDTLVPVLSDSVIVNGPTSLCAGGSVLLTAYSGPGYNYQWKKDGIDIPGATSQSYLAAATGNYNVFINDWGGSFCEITSDSVSITASPVAMITPQGSTTFCQGDSVVLSVVLQSGCIYQWKKDGINIPGATAVSYTAAIGGVYKVKVTNTVGGCSQTTNPGITVTVIPLPSATITAMGPTTFCTGENVLLTVSWGTGARAPYQWQKNGASISGATLSSYSATASGQYNCVVTTTACGIIVSNTITVTVNQLPSAAITYTGSTTFCMGDTLVLIAPTGANKAYQWKKGGIDISGATHSSYAATTGGNYKVTVTNTVTGCGQTTATATVLATNPQPSATITPQGPTTFCAGGSVLLKGNAGTGYTYQWKKGGTDIAGATNKNFTATFGGVYKLKVMNTYGCSTLSGGVTVTVPCKEGESESEGASVFDVKVYPNPSSGDFIFETEHSITEKISVSVYDMVGKLILSGEFFNSQFTIRNPQLSPGVYAATITDGKNKKVLRIVKTK